ncbi:MAG TPA: S41 family peptidase [Bryobacteraceae bacterium]|nr:S41 family peptidase [Bryobacteraceae bacterium]
MTSRRRHLFFVPLIVVLSTLLGGVFGPGLTGVSAASPQEQDEIQASVRSFSRLYAVVEQNFAEPLDPDKAVYNGAIPGMLRTLDPHSSFFDPRYFQLLREEQKGHYYGVGMKVGPRNNKTIVIEVFAGAPAYKSGLRPGDVIIEVNGKSTEGLNTTEVADLLKGPRGTAAVVRIMRAGNEQPLVFNIIRDEISRKSVPDAYWVRPGIAYMHIQQFNETTSREVDENLRTLGEESVKGLILDLRGNPGGLLNEGVAVADRFLRKGQTIVSHRGRASAEKPYVARHGNGGRDYPIVVLVNRQSASAAEIVAGALQDHDRGWVLGDNTFGKGLVQTVYPLSENTGLALTTAKYYTPSGRLIQRDYSSRSFFDYYYRKNTDTKNPLDAKMTDSGRTVYGGGGIAPDEKFVPPRLNRFQMELYKDYAFFNFTSKYLGTRDIKVTTDWEPGQSVMAEFRQFLIDESVSFNDVEFAQNEAWVKSQLKREMYASALSIDAANRIAIESDPAVEKAVQSLPKARALLETAKKLIAQRSAK